MRWSRLRIFRVTRFRGLLKEQKLRSRRLDWSGPYVNTEECQAWAGERVLSLWLLKVNPSETDSHSGNLEYFILGSLSRSRSRDGKDKERGGGSKASGKGGRHNLLGSDGRKKKKRKMAVRGGCMLVVKCLLFFFNFVLWVSPFFVTRCNILCLYSRCTAIRDLSKEGLFLHTYYVMP